jgi:uncharacterized membrane protein YqgA involved in biofilm formation
MTFWSRIDGTVFNTITVLVGSLIGMSAGTRIPERYQKIILTCLGLMTVTLGIDAAVLLFSKTVDEFRTLGDFPATYGARLAMVTISSLLIGAVLGTALRIQDRIEGLGSTIHKRFGRGDAARFAEGFLTASVIFCVGPLTLLGCIQNGVDGNSSLLQIKSVLDGFCSIALAASLGLGVLASVITVVVVQATLSLTAATLINTFPTLQGLPLDLANVVGGIILLATALMILEIKKIPVANLVPGIFVPPFIIWIVEAVAPGTLIPAV